MSNKVTIYTNRIYTTNENIIDNNDDNATNKNVNDNNSNNELIGTANENNIANATNKNENDNNSNNELIVSANENNTVNTTNENVNENNTDNTINENVNGNNTDNVQNSSGNNKNCVIRFKNNHKVLFVLLIIISSLVLLAGIGVLIYKLKDRNKCKNGNCEDGKGDGIYASNVCIKWGKISSFYKKRKTSMFNCK